MCRGSFGLQEKNISFRKSLREEMRADLPGPGGELHGEAAHTSTV